MTLSTNKDSKLKSSVYLVIIQIGTFIFPLILVPYIVWHLGIEKYGLVYFIQSVVAVFAYFVNYSFSQTGIRDLVNTDNFNREYSNIIVAKIFTLIVSILIAVPLFFIDPFKSEKLLYLYSFLFLIVNFGDLTFVYLSIEKLKDYAIMNTVGSGCVLISSIIFIAEKEDYIYVPVLLTLPRIIISLFAFFYLYLKFGIYPNQFKIEGVARQIKNGFHIFSANIFNAFYTKSTPVLLGFIANQKYVGYYGIVDQLLVAYMAIQGKILAVYYPPIAQALKSNINHAVRLVKENIFIITCISLPIFIFTQYFSYDILQILFRENANFSMFVLQILSLNFIIIPISSILGITILLPLNKDNEMVKPSIFAVVFNLFIGSVLIYFFKHIGAAFSVTIIEMIIMFYYFNKAKYYGINVADREVFVRLLKYSLFLAVGLLFLKWVYISIDSSILIKFPVVVVLYCVYVLITLNALNMVDIRRRKIIIKQAEAIE